MAGKWVPQAIEHIYPNIYIYLSRILSIRQTAKREPISLRRDPPPPVGGYVDLFLLSVGCYTDHFLDAVYKNTVTVGTVCALIYGKHGPYPA